MNYLIVSGTTFDMAGRAMSQGAINGISKLDHHAHFCALEQPMHHGENYIGWYHEPEQNDEAFSWADIILDIAGLHTNQGNKFQWLYLRQKYNKPYIFMSQTFKNVDPVLFKCPKIKIVARGQRSANRLRNNGIPCHGIAPDLSFLVEPKPVDLDITIGRVFNTHFTKKDFRKGYVYDPNRDIQIIEKMPSSGQVWEPVIDAPIIKFHGTPEEYFWIVGQASHVICSRYQVACAAILAGIKPKIYGMEDPLYDEKYLDLMDYYDESPLNSQTLRSQAMLSCELAWDLVNGIQ